MSKHAKLAARLKARPRDFTFQELTALMEGLGYKLNQRGSGSRVRFEHAVHPPVLMHKPHPSPVLKPYLIKMILEMLTDEGLI